MSEIQPVLLSSIICDRVIFDKISGMPSIINIIQTINATKYPAQHAQLVFFCELTNGHGQSRAAIRLVDTQEDDRIIFEQKGVVSFKDVQQIVTLAMNLQGVVFPRPGEYRFQLFTNDVLLGERRILCREIKLPAQEGGGQE
ncbi:MAG: DUF6941 family protein [Planctomycetota bacterium]|jgi:hypothetical protein